MRLVEQIYSSDHLQDFRTQYVKYRVGRLKHQYWLWNRKRRDKTVDWYDAMILQNCKPGTTAFFASSGHYLRDIWPNIDSLEMHPVVKEFYPDVVLIDDRKNICRHIPHKYDNFAVVNNRGDHWVGVDGLTDHLINYCQALNPGARLFYSFRDTQIHYHRLRIDAEHFFLSWAHSLAKHDLSLAWYDINFRKKNKDGNGDYDALENPDTTNGNLKFWFTYRGQPWPIVT
jgi:hypothetical protein